VRGFLRVGALVDEPVLLQAVFEPGALDELPHALRACAREGRVLEGALDDRHVGQVERQPFGLEHFLNHRDVLHRAVQRLAHEVAQAALEQLDVPEHLAVDRDGKSCGVRRSAVTVSSVLSVGAGASSVASFSS
jgi:hypothetical protein